MSSVTVVTCVRAGTEGMFRAFVASLIRHPISDYWKLAVLTAGGPGDVAGMLAVADEVGLDVEMDVHVVSTGLPAGAPREHGSLLDWYIPKRVETSCVMTMDSDCFPITDGWYESLRSSLTSSLVAGILQPWEPPPADMDRTRVEWRLRSQQCWDRTHVACQLMRATTANSLRENGALYVDGDDTGLALSNLAAQASDHVFAGFKPTRCPTPRSMTKVDPEFNRYVGVVYGDQVYHHGGYTRTRAGDDAEVMASAYGWVGDMVLERRGAEFLLEPGMSYEYRFDREEEVAKEKFDRIFGLRSGAE